MGSGAEVGFLSRSVITATGSISQRVSLGREGFLGKPLVLPGFGYSVGYYCLSRVVNAELIE
jgi:hypothetical protein